MTEPISVDVKCQTSDIEDLVRSFRRSDPLREPYHEERNAAGSCDCRNCRSACSKHPGFFDPLGFVYYLISKIDGEYTEEDIQEQFKKELDMLQLDFWKGEVYESSVYMLRPRMNNEPAGKKVKFFPRGVCSMLGSKGCKFDPNQRPMECRTFYGCTKKKFDAHKQTMKNHWNTPLGKKLIAIYTKLGKEKYGDSFQKNSIEEDPLGSLIEMMQALVEG